MGSSGGRISLRVRNKARALGGMIAAKGCVLITGACPGIPHEAVLGAKAKGGLTIGISPALSPQEHRDLYKSPLDHYDALIYTGSGLMGREVTNIRSCDLIVIAGGRSGTLGEFAIAYDEGRVIGVLQGTGGIADRMQEIVGFVQKGTGSRIFYDDDPGRLLDKMLRYLTRVGFHPPREQEA